MILFDLYCEKCGNLEKDVFINFNEIENRKCNKCNEKNLKNVSFGYHFELKYNPKTDVCGWGNDGYAKSQYWRAIDEARDRGEKVKGWDEDLPEDKKIGSALKK